MLCDLFSAKRNYFSYCVSYGCSSNIGKLLVKVNFLHQLPIEFTKLSCFEQAHLKAIAGEC